MSKPSSSRVAGHWLRRQAQETETVDLKISGRPETVQKICRFLGAVELLGVWGSSRVVKVFVDGDGIDRLKVKGLPKEYAPDSKEMNEVTERDEFTVTEEGLTS